MRIVSGIHKGLKLLLPDQNYTRPTPDKVRSAAFNILQHRYFEEGFNGVCVLDAFSGSGSLGLEALSRGAECVQLVEKNKKVFSVLQQNASHFDRTKILMTNDDIFNVKLTRSYDLVFLDPPFHEVHYYQKTIEYIKPYLNKNALIYAEMPNHLTPEIDLDKIDERKYGSIKICFYKA